MFWDTWKAEKTTFRGIDAKPASFEDEFAEEQDEAFMFGDVESKDLHGQVKYFKI